MRDMKMLTPSVKKSLRSELLRKWLRPDDFVRFSWDKAPHIGRVLEVERTTVLLEFRHGRFVIAKRLPYDRVRRVLATIAAEIRQNHDRG